MGTGERHVADAAKSGLGNWTRDAQFDASAPGEPGPRRRGRGD